jgi:L-amino acid N-acyltransferase YncA
MPGVLRHVDPGRDAQACAAIYAPFVRDTAISLEEEPPDAAEMAARISHTEALYPWLVLERDGVVAGFAYASQHRARIAYRWSTDVTVYVDPTRHRRGLGRRLYDALLPLLRAQGLRTACAGITLPNDASVGLHEAMGFTSIGVYRHIGFKHGAWRDVGWWQLDLGQPGDGAPDEPKGPQRLDPTPPG